jgi:hypothetical protein
MLFEGLVLWVRLFREPVPKIELHMTLKKQNQVEQEKNAAERD